MSEYNLKDNLDPDHDTESEDEDDPFAHLLSTHPALRETYDLSSDIYHALFDRYFNSVEFNHWVQRESSRQIHWSGGPGSGKVIHCFNLLHNQNSLHRPL
jgi:hypothetical protein